MLQPLPGSFAMPHRDCFLDIDLDGTEEASYEKLASESRHQRRGKLQGLDTNLVWGVVEVGGLLAVGESVVDNTLVVAVAAVANTVDIVVAAGAGAARIVVAVA